MIARKNPDGSEGTGTLELMCQTAKARKETITISGCFVKNDKNLERFIQKHTSSSVDMDPFDKNKYCFYFFNALDSNYHELNPVTTTVTYYRYSETKIEKICEIKNPQIIKVNEHSFLVCDSKDLNDSKFLEKHSKRVMISQSLDVTKDIKGLSQDQQSKTKIKFIPFKIMHCKSNMYSCCIAESRYEKLEDAGPILLPINGNENVVAGGYRKTDNGRISISIFGKNQETIDISDDEGPSPYNEPEPLPGNGNPPNVTVPRQDVDEPDSNPSRLKLSDLFDQNRSALDDLGLYLDLKYRVLQNWRNLADLLNAPTHIKDRCESNKKHSPTELLFDIPKVSSVPLEQLLQLLEDIPRNDVRDKIKKIPDSRWNEKVSETLMKDYDLFDEVAVALDKDSRLKNNWEKLGQKLGVRRDDLNQIKRGNNSANELLLYAYRTLEPEKLEAGWFYSKINESFPCRKDIKDLMDGLGITQEDNRSLKNVFEPESENIRKLCALLNRNAGGTLKDWRNLAIEWGIEKKIYDQFDNQEKLSPTKILLEDWLLNEKPNFTVGELCEHLRTMKRNDARELLKEKVNEHMRKISGTGR